jgi:hypothetical protein
MGALSWMLVLKLQFEYFVLASVSTQSVSVAVQPL